ncbi:M28 family peptidase [Prolixibacteraceae bacterium JC049]|nr:M28 family peptidase [Prolixibacteraceae bacterium JC049]
MKWISITSIVLLMLASCAKQQQNAEEVITYANIEKHIQELSNNKYKGRKPMSDTEEISIGYIAEQMKEIGLAPANNGSYFQNVPLMKVKSQISPTLDIQLKKETLNLKKLDEYITFSRKVKPALEIEDSEIIFAGFGITAPEYQRNDFEGVDVKGKTILVFVNDPGYGKKDSYFKGNTMTYYGRWTYKFEEAARRGAKACIIIHETGPAGYPWAVVRNNAETAKMYLQDKDGYKNRCDLEGWITRKAAEKLFASYGKSFDEMKQMALQKDFKPFSMNAKASAWIKSEFQYGESKNVCGMIKGTERPDEAIVYTAHWDHLGVGRVIKGDSIYNGATDNASAVSWMLEMARAFKAQKPAPKRSILFLSVTAEEQGLLGSYHYTKHPIFPMNKTVACINTDVILFLGSFNDVTLTGNGQSELDLWVEEEAKALGRYIAPDPQPDNGMYFRSDHFPFAKLGVPSLFAKGYIDAKEYGPEKTLQLVKDYWKNIYHKPQDEYVKERDNLQGLVDDARLMYRVGAKLANSNEFPKWNPTSEFKAIREKSLKK